MQIMHNVLDPADAPANDGVMIALLPITTEWSKLDMPHLTLVYAGTTADVKLTDFNELAKDTGSLAMLSGYIQLRVQGVEVFGDTDKVNVLKLQPTSELLAMRRSIQDWNASEFPFNPHCTIGPVGGPVDYTPSVLGFDRIMAAYGNESLTFWLKGCGRSSGMY